MSNDLLPDYIKYNVKKQHRNQKLNIGKPMGVNTIGQKKKETANAKTKTYQYLSIT